MPLSIKRNAKLRALMAKYNVTQGSLAEELKIGVSTFNRKLNGAAPWYSHECALIAKVFGKSVEDIFPAVDEIPEGGRADACSGGCSLVAEKVAKY